MTESQQLSTPRLAIYGLPGLPLAALGLPLYIYLPTYYAEELGLGLAVVGLALLIARVTDVISDPLVGWLSDHLPFRQRRKWLIMITTPLLMFSITNLFSPPSDAGALWLLAWSLLTYLGWTLYIVPYTAWGAELSGDYDHRTSITTSREGFVLVGTLLAAGLPFITGLASDQTGSILQQLETSLLLLLPLLTLILILVVPEQHHIRQPLGLTHGLRLLRENQPFRRLLTAYLTNGIANGLPATLFLLYVTHVLKIPEQFGLLLGIYFLAGIIGLPLGLWLARKLDKHHVWALSMVWASCVFLWVPLLGEGDFLPFLAICILTGLSLGIDLALPASMQADVIDLDKLNGGGNRSGLFFGLWGMATKLALAIAVGIAFPLLEISGFGSTGSPTSTNLLVLALCYSILPIPFKLFSARLIWQFSLGRAEQNLISKRLEEIHP